MGAATDYDENSFSKIAVALIISNNEKMYDIVNCIDFIMMKNEQ